MRFEIDLPKELIKEAMELIKAKAKNETLINALECLIKQEKRMKLIQFKGKVNFNIDLKS